MSNFINPFYQNLSKKPTPRRFFTRTLDSNPVHGMLLFMKFIVCLLCCFVSFSLWANISGCSTAGTQQIAAAEHKVLLRLIDLEKNWDNFRLDQVKENFVLPNHRLWVNQDPHY